MADKPTILVTGSNGQLGMELRELADKFSEYHFLFTTKEALPVNELKKMREFFSAYSPSYFINCAAYTAVDKAENEEETDTVFDINANCLDFLADLCEEYQTKLIHLSTDYVFDGTATRPYKEDDPTHPINAYGASKLMGENYVLNGTDAIVFRTSWVYSSYGKNFVKTMLRLMSEREEIKVVNDQTGSPTYAADLAEAILQIIAGGKWQKGIYHYSNAGEITWFDFANAIAEISKSKCRVLPISTADYPTKAARPAYSVLDKTKIQQTFHIKLKPWKESLARCLSKLQHTITSLPS
ncbi:MAG: dTDP-4-dehydrorhamnose reductase [Chitinophagaceae bacterium]